MKSVFFAVSSLALALAGPGGHYHCPQGFELVEKKSGSICVKEVTKRVFYTCPDGWTKMRKNNTFQCKLRTTVEPTFFCQDPFELVDGKCLRMIEKEPEMRCPKGFSDNEGTCEKKNVEDAALRCPEGQELLADGKCLAKDELDVSFRCPKGELTDDNMCMIRKVIDAPRRCPDGFRNVDGVCTRRIEEDVETTCPDDTIIDASDDDFCVGRSISNPQRICPRPGIEQDNMCFKKEVEMKVPRCAEGWQVVHRSDRVVCKKCDDEEERKCVYERPHYTCPAGFESTGEGKDAVCIKTTPVDFRYVCSADQGTLRDVNGEPKCVKPIRVRSTKTCSDGFKRKGSKCVKIEKTDFEYFCPEGTGPTDQNKCIIEELVPATPFCPKGQLVGDKCIVKKFSPAEYFCADADAELRGKRCVTIETADMVKFCRKNFDLEDGLCKRTLMRLPKRQCPPGFSKQNANVCLKITVEPATPACKQNYVLDGENCTRKIVKEPTFHKGEDHDH